MLVCGPELVCCFHEYILVEMKYLFKNRWETSSHCGFADQNIAHLGLPALAGLAGRHYLQVALKILDLHISEKLRIVKIDGIVPAPRALEVCQQLWPDLPVTPAIFFLRTGLDPHHKSNALHNCVLSILTGERSVGAGVVV